MATPVPLPHDGGGHMVQIHMQSSNDQGHELSLVGEFTMGILSHLENLEAAMERDRETGEHLRRLISIAVQNGASAQSVGLLEEQFRSEIRRHRRSVFVDLRRALQRRLTTDVIATLVPMMKGRAIDG